MPCVPLLIEPLTQGNPRDPFAEPRDQGLAFVALTPLAEPLPARVSLKGS